jgi:hypothetical protein
MPWQKGWPRQALSLPDLLNYLMEQHGLSRAEMGITETTAKVHRSNMMRKIEAASVAELCRMVDKLKLLPENSRPA